MKHRKQINPTAAAIIVALSALWGCLLVSGALGQQQPGKPAHGISAPCKIVEVYDGDTITVDVTLRVRVRLLDCWAPELREEGGEESRDHLSGLALDNDGTLYVTFDGNRTAGDAMSFNRVLGRVYLADDDKDLSARQVEAGHATKDR